MAIMDYVTPGITRIDFEDSLFVTTELDKDENKGVKACIESLGGIIRDSVTKTTDFLIYRDGKEETAKYRKAMDLIQDKGLEITVLPLSLFCDVSAGDGIMEFGRYPFEADGTEKPIRWIVLKREEKKALLLSTCGLDAKPYNDEDRDVTWENCTLRNWLNGEFIETAFTDEEQRRILLTTLRNEDNPRNRTLGGNDTEDRVFLLSVSEAEKYLPEDLFRRRGTTPFAEKNGADQSEGYCFWWLRSPGDNPNKASFVWGDDISYLGGFIDDYGRRANDRRNAVCPALWIDLESIDLESGKEGRRKGESSVLIMDYVTPGITKIDFEDSLFVTTELDKDENKEVNGYIESRGGIIKNSVTKTTDFLIYKDGKEKTEKYRKAMELIRANGLEITVLPLSLFLEIGIGEGLMEFGRYPFEKDGTETPIRWIILKREENKAFLLSENGLDARPYNEEYKDVTWENCTLRKWLNGKFYDAAFSEEEKRRIMLTKLNNEDNPQYRTPGGNDTEDRVFLLSFDEAEKYLHENLARRRKPTPYAVKNGVHRSWGYDNCSWWLRSPGCYPAYAAVVVSGGLVDLGDNVDYGNYAVCPALWIDLESGI